MRELKIYQTIKELSTIERSGFKKFLASPFFNVNKNLILLYDHYLALLKNDIPVEQVKETTIWKDVFPSKKEDLKQLRHWNNHLINLVIEYFAQLHLRADTLLYNNIKYKGIGQKKQLKTLIEKTEKKHEKVLNSYPELSSEYFQARYEHERIANDLTSDSDRKKSKSKVEDQINLDKISYNLDQFYIIEKLKLYIALLSWKRSYKIEKEIHHIEEIKQILSKETASNSVISAYMLIVKTLEEPEKEAYFNILKKLIEKERMVFSLQDFNYIYESLISYCIRKINRGNESYTPVTLSLYKKALDYGIFSTNGSLSQITFNNVIGMACRNKEYKWAEDFAVQYSSFLPEVSRENAVSFSIGRIETHKGNYRKVIEVLRTVEYETVIYNLNSKVFLLISYYELQEYSALDSLINSFTVYLNREKSMSTDRKKRYSRLINFTKRIANVNPRNKKKIDSIKSKIQETKGVLNKEWLLEKITELETVNYREQLLKKKKS